MTKLWTYFCGRHELLIRRLQINYSTIATALTVSRPALNGQTVMGLNMTMYPSYTDVPVGCGTAGPLRGRRAPSTVSYCHFSLPKDEPAMHLRAQNHEFLYEISLS